MKFGIINIFPPAHAALDNMRLAERLDFDTFWVTDSHVIWNECYSTLGWLVGQRRSDRLQLVSGAFGRTRMGEMGDDSGVAR